MEVIIIVTRNVIRIVATMSQMRTIMKRIITSITTTVTTATTAATICGDYMVVMAATGSSPDFESTLPHYI